MNGVAIYMEGGGRSRNGKAALRKGMDRFLEPLKREARKRSLPWKLVPCGSREEAYRRFKRACAEHPVGTQILLVDSETRTTRPPREHLKNGDGWDLDFAREETVHLMAQVMETWIVADPEALTKYYGRNFNAAELPMRRDLEQEPKTSIERALKKATRRTQKGSYHKIKHAGTLLERLDETRVRNRCRHCACLFEEVGAIIETSSRGRRDSSFQ